MQLTTQFLYELFRLFLRSKETLSICTPYLKYEYLPSEAWKKIYKSIYEYYGATGSCVTSGIICQQNASDREVIEIINHISNTNIPDQNLLLKQFQLFIQQSEFVLLHDSLAEMWQEGRRDEALLLLQKKGAELSQLVIRSKTYSRVFGDFFGRTELRDLNRNLGGSQHSSIPTGIDELDEISGGLEQGDTMLITSRSGVGKSTFLKWLGVTAARRGYKVLHFQLEGTKEECLRYYDVLWTGLKSTFLKYEQIDEQLSDKLKKIVYDVEVTRGEIFVEAYEQFGSASINDIRSTLDDFKKMGVDIDYVLIDYFEKCNPVDPSRPDKALKLAFNEKSEQQRRERLADQVKDIAVEYTTRVATATQSNDIPPEKYNNPNFVITRHNISQFKAVVNPFSIHLTLNQTDGERKGDIMRIHIDKNRHRLPGQTIMIYQKRDQGRFYDGKRTRQELLSKTR